MSLEEQNAVLQERLAELENDMVRHVRDDEFSIVF